MRETGNRGEKLCQNMSNLENSNILIYRVARELELFRRVDRTLKSMFMLQVSLWASLATISMASAT